MEVVTRRLAALVVVGAIALFSPLVGAFSRPELVAGVPLLALYVFGWWGGLVLAAWALIGRRRR